MQNRWFVHLRSRLQLWHCVKEAFCKMEWLGKLTYLKLDLIVICKALLSLMLVLLFCILYLSVMWVDITGLPSHCQVLVLLVTASAAVQYSYIHILRALAGKWGYIPRRIGKEMSLIISVHNC